MRALLNKLAPIKDANLVRVLDRREPVHREQKETHTVYSSLLCVLVLSLSWQQTSVFHPEMAQA